MLFHSEKFFVLPSVWQGIEYTWTLIGKKSLLVCFERYHGIPIPTQAELHSDVNTLLMVNINPIC